MQVILLERIGRLGQMGDVVNVKDGYARNFLLPRGKALRATDINKKKFDGQRVQLETRNLELKKEAEAVQGTLEGKTFVAIRQAGDTGHLYGSVSTRDVAEVVTKGGFNVDRGQVSLGQPIKNLGMHQVNVQLHPEVLANTQTDLAMADIELKNRREDLAQTRNLIIRANVIDTNGNPVPEPGMLALLLAAAVAGAIARWRRLH